MNSNPVAVVDKTRKNQVLCIQSHDEKWHLEWVVVEQPCEATRIPALALMSETIEEVKFSAWASQVVGTHKNLIQDRQALIAQGIVDIATRVPFSTKIAKLSSLYKTLPIGMKVLQCMETSSIWFGSGSVDISPNTADTV